MYETITERKAMSLQELIETAYNTATDERTQHVLAEALVKLAELKTKIIIRRKDGRN